MKKKIKTSVGLFINTAILLSISVMTMGQDNGTNSFMAKEKWATDAIFDVPESVCYSPGQQVLYVANISGKPTEKDGKGFISKLSLTGEMINKEWYTGLDAPKGMGIYDNKLYVTNIDEVVAIDLNSAEEAGRWKCEGAKFANDIAITANGDVFISGMQNGAIYRISNGEITRWKAEKTFQKPNGLWTGPDYLYVGAAKHIYRVDYERAEVEKYIENSGGVDGLERIENGFFLKSDWTGHVHVVSPAHPKHLILNTADQKINAADIEYIPSMKMMLVPTFFDNRVVAYEIVK
ncbi:SMP-30/gluconolactonase/LRE family protein [Salinivirga cyanobacteriivorans]